MPSHTSTFHLFDSESLSFVVEETVPVFSLVSSEALQRQYFLLVRRISLLTSILSLGQPRPAVLLTKESMI